jgi:cytoskeleton protein RodZ
MKSVGEQLKLARLHKHWTPQAAAKATKIKVDKLIDLENDSYTKFASPSYARGFVRIYARTLGLDERKILAQLDGKLSEEEEEGVFIAPAGIDYIPEQVEVAAPVRAGRIGQKIVYLFGMFFAFIVVVILMRAYQAGVVTKPPVVAAQTNVPIGPPPATKPEKEAPKAVPVDPSIVKILPAIAVTKPKEPDHTGDGDSNNAVSTNHQLTLQTSKKSSWVRVNLVEDGHEKPVFEGVIDSGQSKSFEGQKFNLKIATPAVVDVILDGVNYGPYSDGDSPESFTLPNVAQSD